MATIINTQKTVKKLENFWNNIHFHPTDAIEDEWGQRILDEVSREKVAQTVRMYAMLEDIVTLVDGKLHYNFTENDIRLDYMVKKGFRVLLCYAFVPPFLATNNHLKSSVSKNKTRYKGKMIVNSYPTDYAVWQEICKEYTKHIISRYGFDTVSTWFLQCYNEPDHSAFFMLEADEGNDISGAALVRAKEYKKLYKAFSLGVDEACKELGFSKELYIGGPAIASNLVFLEEFLKGANEKDYRINYVSGHTYGTHPPFLLSGEKPLAVENNVAVYKNMHELTKKYLPDAPIVLDEWGACSAGFANKDDVPQLMYRETEVFATYFAKLVTKLVEIDAKIANLSICLSGQHEMTEDFSGFRNFFSLNFIKKPIYNAYVVMRKLGENLLSHSATPENLTLLATKDDGGKYSLLFTYSTDNFDKALPTITEKIILSGESGTKKVTIFKIDDENMNPYRVFVKNGYDKNLSEEQISQLQNVAQCKETQQFEVSGNFIEFEITMKQNSMLLCVVE